MKQTGAILLRLGVCDKVRAGADGPDRAPIHQPRSTLGHVSRELGIIGDRIKRGDSRSSLYPRRPSVSTADLRAHALMVTTTMKQAFPHTANFLQDRFDAAVQSVGWSKQKVAAHSGASAFGIALVAALKHAVAERSSYFQYTLGDRYQGIPATVTEELSSLHFN